MSTKRPKKEVKSDAILFLEKLGGGPLTFGRLLYFFLFVIRVLGLLRASHVRVLFAGSLLCFVAAWIINGTWWCWWFGASFGNRAFIEFLVPMSLAWCAGWAQGGTGWKISRIFPTIILSCLALNAVLWSGFLLKRYSHEDPLTLSDTYLWWINK